MFNIPGLFATAREKLKWADGKLLKTFFDDQILSLLGPKNAEDEAKAARKKEKKPEGFSFFSFFFHFFFSFLFFFSIFIFYFFSFFIFSKVLFDFNKF